ncbi:MAG: patatin-like phospholipase family protein [Ekhidna sp.]|uniref:patatin-like phospholipase family protein n=1 Tax=Ekhidna sp. TaxID=2608089 RepID=UPI0032ECA871
MEDFKILTLDGGGSKGIYSLGVLSELEKAVGGNLCEHFQLIYGTSTGSIIASLIGLGYSVEDIKKKYLELIPSIMSCRTSKSKSEKLLEHANSIFGDRDFNYFKTGIGIVAVNYDTQKPLIFKNEVDRAHGVKPSFEPGFGLTIAEAVMASCAAAPIFKVRELHTKNKGVIQAMDGGFVANNPTLFAMIDATKALNFDLKDIAVLSVGVGNYVEKPMSRKMQFLKRFEMAKIASRILVASSNTTEVIANLLFPSLKIVRINETFSEPEHGTNMIEKDIKKLEKMYQLGIRSYAKFEKETIALLGV